MRSEAIALFQYIPSSIIFAGGLKANQKLYPCIERN